MGKGRTPGHATVAAYLALFVALATGGAYAAEQIGSDQIEAGAVKSRHVSDDAIRNRHIREGNVNFESIANRTILGSNVAENTLTGQEVDESSLNLPPGQQGPKGETGNTGPPGPPGATGSDAASFQAARIENIDPIIPSCGPISGVEDADPACSREMISPASPIVATNLSVRLDSPVPGGSFLTVIMLADDLAIPLTCVLPDGAQTCQSGAVSVPIPANTRLEWFISHGPFFPAGSAASVTWQATSS